MASQKSESADVLAVLEEIKRLLAYNMLLSGASQGDIAAALKVSQPSVSRMFPNMAKRQKGKKR